jgi:hypothetical protein
VVVKLSWSIASLTRGFSGISGNTPRSDHPVTDEPGRSDQDEKRSLIECRVRSYQQIEDGAQMRLCSFLIGKPG